MMVLTLMTLEHTILVNLRSMRYKKNKKNKK